MTVIEPPFCVSVSVRSVMAVPPLFVTFRMSVWPLESLVSRVSVRFVA